jgi:cytochrome P450
MSSLLYQTPVGLMIAYPLVNGMQKLAATSKQFFEERREAGAPDGGRKDFFYYLLRGRDAETDVKHADLELAAESNLLLVAGSDTTATTLSACIFYLSRHPRIAQTLRTELEANFDSVEEINYWGTKLSSLPYLRAVIDETLRMNPPVGGHLPRTVLEPGIEVDGIFYLPGIELGVSQYAIHHREDYHPDPYTFKPERWIVNKETGVTKEMVDREQSAFCPFSVGHRGCIGKNLAYIEMLLAIARVVYRYDLEEEDGWDEKLGGFPHVDEYGNYATKDGFVSVKDGPLVKFRERKTKL